jgi:hypothetical protein
MTPRVECECNRTDNTYVKYTYCLFTLNMALDKQRLSNYSNTPLDLYWRDEKDCIFIYAYLGHIYSRNYYLNISDYMWSIRIFVSNKIQGIFKETVVH